MDHSWDYIMKFIGVFRPAFLRISTSMGHCGAPDVHHAENRSYSSTRHILFPVVVKGHFNLFLKACGTPHLV